MSVASRPALLGRVGLLVGAILLVSLAAEVALRWQERIDADTSVIHRRSSDPRLVYELRPGAESRRDGVRVAINEAGFRDDPFPAPMAEGGLRIVVLGDSVAAGLGVAMEAAFPQRLEQMLRERPPPGVVRTDVLNLGVYGYSTDQEIRLLETTGFALSPDLVILAYHLNDADSADAGQKRHYRRSRSALVDFVVERARRVSRRRDRRGYFERIHTDHAAEVEEHFARLGSLARSRMVPLWVAVLPVFKWGEKYPWEPIHARLAELAKRNGLRFIDLREALATHPAGEVSQEPWHPNARGHEIIAATLAARVREMGLGASRP